VREAGLFALRIASSASRFPWFVNTKSSFPFAIRRGKSVLTGECFGSQRFLEHLVDDHFDALRPRVLQRTPAHAWLLQSDWRRCRAA
jgi:hypothetical protein